MQQRRPIRVLLLAPLPTLSFQETVIMRGGALAEITRLDEELVALADRAIELHARGNRWRCATLAMAALALLGRLL